jgi:hypothetical protein
MPTRRQIPKQDQNDKAEAIAYFLSLPFVCCVQRYPFI